MSIDIETFTTAYVRCIKAGVHIVPECIINKSKWRIVVEFKDKKGNLKNRKDSDPIYYYSKKDYENKIMELYLFYSYKV